MPVTIVGNNTPTAGGVVYGDGTNYVSTSAGTSGQVLLSNGSSAPSFGAVGVAGGGTGASSLTANNVLLGNGTSAIQTVAPGTNGNVLTSNGTTWVSQAVSAGALTFITSSTVAGSPQFLDVTWSGTTYDDYLILFENFTGLNTHRFAFRVYNASSSLVTSFDYNGAGVKSEGSGASGITQSSNDYIEPFANNNSATAAAIFFGAMWVLNANTSTAYRASVHYTFTSRATSGSGINGGGTGGFGINLSTGIRGIRIFDAVGNGLNSGTMRLYGVQKS
jgi:hypothetical protein